MPKLCDEGETNLLEVYLANQTLYLGLYMDNAEPGEADTLTSISEASGGDYARKTLAAGIGGDPNWTVAGDLGSRPEEVWTFTGAVGNVYGYFLATSVDDSGKLVAVEHFSDGPYNIQNNGDQIKVTPKVRAS